MERLVCGNYKLSFGRKWYHKLRLAVKFRGWSNRKFVFCLCVSFLSRKRGCAKAKAINAKTETALSEIPNPDITCNFTFLAWIDQKQASKTHPANHTFTPLGYLYWNNIGNES
jgi:hypothetical protein